MEGKGDDELHWLSLLLCTTTAMHAASVKGRRRYERERWEGKEGQGKATETTAASRIQVQKTPPTTETRHGFTDNKVAATSSTFREPTHIPVNGSIVYCLYSQREAERKETKGSSREPRDGEAT